MPTFVASTPPVRQDGEWQCSAAALAWMLQSAGISASETDVVGRLGNARISSDVGLHDASGSGLADVAQSYGIGAHNGSVGYDDVLSMAGNQPVGIGGVGWYHWSGVSGRDGDDLLLANPAPGYRGVGDRMTRGQFGALGPFYAVWLDASASASGGTAGDITVAGLSLPVPMLLVAAAAAAAFLLLGDSNPNLAVGRRVRRWINPDFFTEGGQVHPIRNSSDYDPAVDRIQREQKHERGRAAFYSGIRREKFGRLEGGVDRPPWAAGLSNAQLQRIARDHDQRATTEGWWERAHLTKGSGELRRVLAESGYRQERSRSQSAPTSAPARLTSAQRRTARGDFSDLPF